MSVEGGYSLYEEGSIAFDDGGWAYTVSHSFHWDDSARTSIGDATLAIDHEGNFWTTDSHVCPALEIMPLKGGSFATAQDFFATAPISVGGKPWRRYDKASSHDTDAAFRRSYP